MTLSTRQRRTAAHYKFSRQQAQILVDLGFDLSERRPLFEYISEMKVSNARFTHGNGIIIADITKGEKGGVPEVTQITPQHPYHAIMAAGFWGAVSPLSITNMMWMDPTETEVISAERTEDGKSISISRGEMFFDDVAAENYGPVAAHPGGMEPTAEEEKEDQRTEAVILTENFIIALVDHGVISHRDAVAWFSGKSIPAIATAYLAGIASGTPEHLRAVATVYSSGTIGRLDGLVFAVQQSPNITEAQLDDIFGVQ